MRARTPATARKNAATVLRVRTNDVSWPVGDFVNYLDEKMQDAGIDRDSRLAAAAGIDPSLISKWRSGRQQPSRKSLKALAPTLRVSPVMLYLAAGLDEAEDLDVTAEADSWPAEFHELRTLFESFEAIGRADVVRRDMVRLVAGLRAELAELEKPRPDSRRRVG